MVQNITHVLRHNTGVVLDILKKTKIFFLFNAALYLFVYLFIEWSVSMCCLICIALTVCGAELNNTNDKRSDRYFSHCQNVSEWGIWWPVQLINAAWVFSFMRDVRDVYCCNTIICNISSLENYMLTTECIRRSKEKVKDDVSVFGDIYKYLHLTNIKYNITIIMFDTNLV